VLAAMAMTAAISSTAISNQAHTGRPSHLRLQNEGGCGGTAGATTSAAGCMTVGSTTLGCMTVGCTTVGCSAVGGPIGGTSGRGGGGGGGGVRGAARCA